MKPSLFLFLLSISAAAESLTQPPPLIRIIQTIGTKPAVDAPSGDTAAGVFLFGMSALTGPSETWLLETHISFAGLEQFDSGVNHPDRGRNAGGDDSRSLVAFYRQWWSHRPEEAIQALRKARYIQVSYYRTGVGSEAEFAELLRARKASLDSINLDRPDMVYQVIAGAPSGTYLVLSPLPSLKVLDDGVSRSAAAYLRSTGSPSTRGGANVRPGSELSHENMLFRLEPRLSSVSEEFAGADPDFWQSVRRSK
jgi:hypothetical protein